LDSATRAVFIDLTVYNGNMNLFGVLTIAAEFTASGSYSTWMVVE
jgi:hypothetical protein